MSLATYTGPFGRPQLQHLLRRTLFGVSPADLAHFAGMTLQQVVNELLTFSTTTPPPLKTYWVNSGGNPNPNGVDPNVPFGTTWVDTPRDWNWAVNVTPYRNESYMRWWVGNMVTQERNLREKMTLYWSNHLVTQVYAVGAPDASYRWNQYLRDNCLGNFRQMMFDITLDPAMLIYLNGFLNQVGAADENYARELMELFTLGEGSGYTEEDVQKAAKVLTGFTTRYFVNNVPSNTYVIFIPADHDTTNKQFSAFFNNTVVQGQTGPNGGTTEINALLDMIFQKQEVSLHVCRRLYRFFVHSEITPQVESQVIAPLAQIFRNHAGSPDQMRHVMYALLTSARFFSEEVRSCMVKSPVDLVIGHARTFMLPMPDSSLPEARYNLWAQLHDVLENCGQPPAVPPDVAGWPAYYMQPAYDTVWVDTATYVHRRNFVRNLLINGLSTPNNLYDPASRNLQFQVNLVQLVQQFSNPSDPNVVVSEACDLLFAVPVSQAVKDHLKNDFLLQGQTMDAYWTSIWNAYVNNPEIPDPVAQSVPVRLRNMFLDMMEAAEFQLH
jgi:uncharacterized protein (DUF1800 family)